MKDIFVTGITGLLGQNVLLALLDRGYTIKALVRDISKIQYQHENLKLIVGDITNIESLKQAIQNCTIVIHIAATTDQSFSGYKHYYRVNVEGTKNVFEAARASGLQRFIYISSANTIGFGSENRPGDESFTIAYPFTKSFYAKSKLEAQQFLLSHKKEMDIIILNPTFMLGAYDTMPSSGKLVLMGYKKYLMCVPKGGKNFIHVKDAAEAICNSITMGRNGECYVLGNKDISFKEFYQLQKKAAGYKQIIFTLPIFIFSGLGYLGNFFQRIGIKNTITKRNLQQLCIQEYYSSQKAIEELKLPQTPLVKAIEDSINWFKQQGKIK